MLRAVKHSHDPFSVYERKNRVHEVKRATSACLNNFEVYSYMQTSFSMHDWMVFAPSLLSEETLKIPDFLAFQGMPPPCVHQLQEKQLMQARSMSTEPSEGKCLFSLQWLLRGQQEARGYWVFTGVEVCEGYWLGDFLTLESISRHICPCQETTSSSSFYSTQKKNVHLTGI